MYIYIYIHIVICRCINIVCISYVYRIYIVCISYVFVSICLFWFARLVFRGRNVGNKTNARADKEPRARQQHRNQQPQSPLKRGTSLCCCVSGFSQEFCKDTHTKQDTTNSKHKHTPVCLRDRQFLQCLLFFWLITQHVHPAIGAVPKD